MYYFFQSVFALSLDRVLTFVIIASYLNSLLQIIETRMTLLTTFGSLCELSLNTINFINSQDDVHKVAFIGKIFLKNLPF